MGKNKSSHKKSKRSRESGWESVALEASAQGDDGLAGFSGLEVWTGPVFEAERKGVESEDDEQERLSSIDDANEVDEGEHDGFDGTAADATAQKVQKKKRKRKTKAETSRKSLKKTKKVEPPGKKTEPVAEKEVLVDTSAWEDLDLHPLIHKALGSLGFIYPTPIQSRSIAAAVRDRKDLFGAAQTGSGKTLAFGLPILQVLLRERDQECEIAESLLTAPMVDMASETELAAPEVDFDPSGFGKPMGDDESEELEELSEGSMDDESVENGINNEEIEMLDKSLGILPTTSTPLKNTREKPLRGLILTPTRELTLQVTSHLEVFGKVCGVRFVAIVGGMSVQKQERLLNKCPEVVVATPGRLWDLISTNHPHLSNLSGLRFMVIDEADKMVKQGNFKELTKIMNAVPEYKVHEDLEDAASVQKKNRGKSKKNARNQDTVQYQIPDSERRMQTFVFSATLTLPSSLHKRLRKGGGGAADGDNMDNVMQKIRFRNDPEIIDLTGIRGVADGVAEACLPCSDESRDVYLYCIISKYPGRTLVFVNAISSVKRVCGLLRTLKIDAQPLHASKQQKQRLKALDRFRNNPNGVMVATDVAARGLDIKDIKCVIHYQVAASADTYIHRSGRTARVENEGIAISLVVPKEALRFSALFSKLNRPIPVEFPMDPVHAVQGKARFSLAVQIDELNRKLEKARPRTSWIDAAAKEMGISVDDVKADKNQKLSSQDRQELIEMKNALVSELNQLLEEPLSQKVNQKFVTGSAQSIETATKNAGESKASRQQPIHQSTKEENSSAEREAGTKSKKRKNTKQQRNGSQDSAKAGSTKLVRAVLPDEDSFQARKRHNKKKAEELIEKALKLRKNRKSQKEKLGYKQKLFVVSNVVGRSDTGPDALHALKHAQGSK